MLEKNVNLIDIHSPNLTPFLILDDIFFLTFHKQGW